MYGHVFSRAKKNLDQGPGPKLILETQSWYLQQQGHLQLWQHLSLFGSASIKYIVVILCY